MTDDLIKFVAGFVAGAVTTVAVFRSSLAVLQAQVSDLFARSGKAEEKTETLERDLNGLGGNVRAELAHLRGLLQKGE